MTTTYKRFGAMEIDGSTNAVATDRSLYTMGGSTTGIANIMAHNKSANTASVIMAIIENGAIGAVTEEDYYWKDEYVPAGKQISWEAIGMNAGDTILVRSDIVDVNFIATGVEFT